MEIWQWGGIAGAGVALVTAVVGAIWWFAKRAIEANTARLDAESSRKIANAEAVLQKLKLKRPSLGLMLADRCLKSFVIEPRSQALPIVGGNYFRAR